MNKYHESLDRLMCNISVARSEYRKLGKAKKDYENLKELCDKEEEEGSNGRIQQK